MNLKEMKMGYGPRLFNSSSPLLSTTAANRAVDEMLIKALACQMDHVIFSEEAIALKPVKKALKARRIKYIRKQLPDGVNIIVAYGWATEYGPKQARGIKYIDVPNTYR